MVADVPLGLFLSGGLDSTAIGWYMCRHSSRVESFSIGFEDATFDETQHARLAAAHLGTSHSVEILSPATVLDIVPRLPDILDEPMADQSILPTYLLSRFARQRVTVALGGDGGDELFMGYNAFQGFRLSALTGRLPWVTPHVAAELARRLPHRIGPLRLRGTRWVAGHADAVFARAVTGHEDLSAYREPRHLIAPSLRVGLARSVFDEPERRIEHGIPGVADIDSKAIVAFFRGYLADDVLVKVDRASMAASLEVRAPFLDAHLVDFMLGVAPSLKLRRMRRKHLLRLLMRDRLPAEIVERPKFGFNAPVGAWLRGPLAPLVRDALSPARLHGVGYLDSQAAARVVDDHLSGRCDNGSMVWKLLQLELWRERWLTQPHGALPRGSPGTGRPSGPPSVPA
jgi:asparagine synthase (glutamine-hydrolysing)